MESSMIVDIWNTFKDSIDKKHIETIAEKYIDVCIFVQMTQHLRCAGR